MIQVLKSVTRYRVGKREFKSAWGAWCALAKTELLNEFYSEADAHTNPPQEDLIWDSVDFNKIYTDLFKQKYPHPYPGEKSPFRKAVENRARELRSKAAEKGVFI
jgi:hypothetical protein